MGSRHGACPSRLLATGAGPPALLPLPVSPGSGGDRCPHRRGREMSPVPGQVSSHGCRVWGAAAPEKGSARGLASAGRGGLCRTSGDALHAALAAAGWSSWLTRAISVVTSPRLRVVTHGYHPLSPVKPRARFCPGTAFAAAWLRCAPRRGSFAAGSAVVQGMLGRFTWRPFPRGHCCGFSPPQALARSPRWDRGESQEGKSEKTPGLG